MAVCAATLAWGTSAVHAGKADVLSFLLVLFATLVAYNFQRLNRLLAPDKATESVMVQWIQRNRAIVIAIMGGVQWR